MTQMNLDELEVTFSDWVPENSIIKVIGVGGGGCNAVDYMYNHRIQGCTFIVCNTDAQALNSCDVPIKIQLGEGLGAGCNPTEGRNAALNSQEEIAEKVINSKTEMLFITAGMGGGTGTGAAPVIAREAKNMGILTVGIVTIPFLFEGNKKIDQALDGVEEISKHVDALLVINNERLREIYPELNVLSAFEKADNTLSIAARSIAEIITMHGIINLDFRDVCTVLKDGGVAIMSTGYGEGDNRVTKAIEDALHSPLLNNNDIFNSKKVLLSISFCSETDGNQLMMDEMNEVHDFMSKFHDDVETKWGLSTDPSLEKKVKITILATGFGISNVPGIQEKLDLEEENRRKDEAAAKEERDDRREGYYGQTNKQGGMRKRPKVYLFNVDDLDNEEVISMIELTPTFNRSKEVLGQIKAKAMSANPIELETFGAEDNSQIITFS